MIKKTILIVALCACALRAQAQGTLQFSAALTGANEVPANNDPTIATGTFWLTGNSLSFEVDVPAVTFISQTASIHGPALPGVIAPTIFDLGGPVFHSVSQFGPRHIMLSLARQSVLVSGLVHSRLPIHKSMT